jgi:hypothetical protein
MVPGSLVTLTCRVNRTTGGTWGPEEIGMVIDVDVPDDTYPELVDRLVLVSFGDRGSDKFHRTRLLSFEQQDWTGERT